MGTAVPATTKPLVSSPEKTNGAKLSRLLIDGGTTVLRNVFDRHHPPANLAADLNTSYSILDNLLRRRILNGHQWEKLFPPAGGVPNSNTFDITLLFLLLIEICGLSPPPSGWHTKPPPGDPSLEANLARIKYYRNVLYGHVTTTGIDAAAFQSLWLEISAVLVALGLDQAEIDRLKTEHCGEEDYLDVLFDWASREEDIKAQLHDIRQSLETIQADLKELKRVSSNLQNLAKSEFKGDIEYHLQKFQEHTREWVFRRVQHWMDDASSQNRVMVISGNAGMGKSVIAAVICQRMQDAGRLSGSHFCQHNNIRYRNPQLMLQSLACHLSHSLPEYKCALEEQLSRNLGSDLNNMGVEELFAVLFKEPLSTVTEPRTSMLMVIDGLDESEYQERNELLDVIANHFSKLPVWIRFLVTTRPQRNITEALKHLKPFQLEANDELNLDDVRTLFERKLQHVIEPEDAEAILNKLVLKSEGLMLYASFLVSFIEENPSVLVQGNLDVNLPLGISSVYHSYFKRLENELIKELGIRQENFLNLLCAVTAAREPLPIGFVSKILAPSSNSLLSRQKVRKAVGSVSSLLPIRDDCLHVIHKSVKDWLTDVSSYGEHDFIMDEQEGHLILSKLCAEELEFVKERGSCNAQYVGTETYALQHGTHHMLLLDDVRRPYSVEEWVKKYVVSLDLVYAKLCVDSVAALKEMFCFQERAISVLLSEGSQRSLSTLVFLLRKYSSTLRDLPWVILQTALNEGGGELHPEAVHVLQTRFLDVPFIEYIDNLGSQRVIQAQFYCLSAVCCFDVSPDLDYMVCECLDGTVQLWSLKTGQLEWVQQVVVKRTYDKYHDSNVPPGTAYRIWYDYTLTFCQSVAFYPLGDFILQGNLASVYTIGGDINKLFPASDCLFTVCAFCKDNTKMLTNSPRERKCVIMWNLENGTEVTRITKKKEIFSFAWSDDGRLIAVSVGCGSRGIIYLLELANGSARDCRVFHSEYSIGFMNFSADNQEIFCLCLTRSLKNTLRLKIFAEDCYAECCKRNTHQLGSDEVFLLGDPIDVPSDQLASVIPFCFVGRIAKLGEETVLMGSPDLNYLSVLSVAELKGKGKNSKALVREVSFSLNGERVYVVTKEWQTQTKLTVWDVSSLELRAQKEAWIISLTPVADGVVLLTRDNCPELWNCELTECVRRWSNLTDIRKVIPLSEEQVACVGRHADVTILATSRGDIMSTISVCLQKRRVLACNNNSTDLAVIDEASKNLECLGIGGLSNTSSVMWQRRMGFLHPKVRPGQFARCVFLPKGDVVVTWNTLENGCGVHLLDVRTGTTVHTLLPGHFDIVDCKIVSDGESLVCCSRVNIVKLFSIRSGHLLSVLNIEERPFCLGACLRMPLIAIGLSGCNFRLLRVRLPTSEEGRMIER